MTQVICLQRRDCSRRHIGVLHERTPCTQGWPCFWPACNQCRCPAGDVNKASGRVSACCNTAGARRTTCARQVQRQRAARAACAQPAAVGQRPLEEVDGGVRARGARRARAARGEQVHQRARGRDARQGQARRREEAHGDADRQRADACACMRASGTRHPPSGPLMAWAHPSPPGSPRPGRNPAPPGLLLARVSHAVEEELRGKSPTTGLRKLCPFKMMKSAQS